jgi:hypothetical protein
MNIIQFWIVDTIVKVGPTANNHKIQPQQHEEQTNTTTDQPEATSDHDQIEDEHSPLLPK